MGTLYAVSDVHGHREDLARALDRVGFGGDDELWVLGDLMDRGPDGFGVLEMVMRLQRESPDRVHVLMGNHEILAVGRWRFPDSRFQETWRINGGHQADHDGLTEAHVAWMAGLPVLGRTGGFLMMHSDTTGYVEWGSSVAEVNAAVSAMLADPADVDAHWEVFARLTSRYQFARHDGSKVAQAVLAVYGGQMIVHGHSIIGSLLEVPSADVTKPVLYAGGLVLAIDGGRYDGGPLLLVELGERVTPGAAPR